MKKVVKGKALNTDTAKMVGTAMIDESKDFIECLYRTKSGTFFIYSVFPKPKMGKQEMSEEITLISSVQAKEWAKQHLTEVEYDEFFGAGSAEELKTITINITEEAYNLLKKEKELTGSTYGEIVSYAVKNEFGRGAK